MPAQVNVRSVLTEGMRSGMAGFDPIDSPKKGYWFRKTRTLPLGPLYETVVFASPREWKCFEVDVCSSMFPVWRGGLGGGTLEHGTGLANLRLNSTAIPMQEIPYTHDGSEAGIHEAISLILRDLKAYAVPFFERRVSQVEASPLLNLGFQWLAEHRAEIEESLIGPLQSGKLTQWSLYRQVAKELGDLLWEQLLRVAHELDMGKDERVAVLGFAYDLIVYDVFVRGGIPWLKK